MAQRGLGTGLGALFGADALEENEVSCTLLPLSRIEAREDQPRKNFDEVSLSELAESIKEHGVIQPLTVRKLKSGYYQIIAGERRWRAARIAGLREIPSIIIEADDRKATELALIENLQREDLNPVEEAYGYKALIDDYGLTQEEVADRVGKGRTTVTNSLRLLTLPESIIAKLNSGELSAGHARALIPLKREEFMLKAAERISSESLSVRQTEALVKRMMAVKKSDSDSDPASVPLVDYVAEVESELGKALGRKVHLSEGKKRGKIEIEYYGEDDRETLISMLIKLGKSK